MAKTKTTFFCNNCGVQASKWGGKCNACGQWNTYVEEIVSKTVKPFSNSKNNKATVPVSIANIALLLKDRKTLYVTGEESAEQIKLRADRINFQNESCLILTETNTQIIPFLEGYSTSAIEQKIIKQTNS